MKKLLISIMAAVLMTVSVPSCVFASTVKSELYEIYATKYYVYAVGNYGLYRVSLKNGKPVAKKKLASCSGDYGMGHLRIKGKYVYFKKTKYASKGKDYLYRVKKTGGKAKKLCTMHEMSEVAFKGKKIYYTYPGYETDENGMILKTYKKVMKLDGSAKGNTEIEAVEKDKYTNKKGYKYTDKVGSKYVILYLKTPKGKIALEKLPKGNG